MKNEYNLSKLHGSQRGKYFKAYRAGHTVRIQKNNSVVSTHYFKPEENAIVLEPDVQKYFPDAKSVNSTLRSLIHLIPATRNKGAKKLAALRHV